jgi:hypothetical protein
MPYAGGIKTLFAHLTGRALIDYPAVTLNDAAVRDGPD